MSATKLIQQIIAKEPAAVNSTFKEIVKPAMAQQIDAKRAEVGANMFTQTKSEG